jgi:hypothetical protein
LKFRSRPTCHRRNQRAANSRGRQLAAGRGQRGVASPQLRFPADLEESSNEEGSARPVKRTRNEYSEREAATGASLLLRRPYPRTSNRLRHGARNGSPVAACHGATVGAKAGAKAESRRRVGGTSAAVVNVDRPHYRCCRHFRKWHLLLRASTQARLRAAYHRPVTRVKGIMAPTSRIDCRKKIHLIDCIIRINRC